LSGEQSCYSPTPFMTMCTNGIDTIANIAEGGEYRIIQGMGPYATSTPRERVGVVHVDSHNRHYVDWNDTEFNDLDYQGTGGYIS